MGDDAKRKAVESGNIVYTCNCGWIDMTHAKDETQRPYVGAKSLWKQIKDETGRKSFNGDGYLVIYGQDAKVTDKPVFGINKIGAGSPYFVKYGLTLAQKKSVALAIFQEISRQFEAMQGLKFWSDSSFSQEDLVSNLIGFYSAVQGVPIERYIELCKPVSVKASLGVFDNSGSPGATKNRTFEPIFHECSECATKGPFPSVFKTIQPAVKGVQFRDWLIKDGLQGPRGR